MVEIINGSNRSKKTVFPHLCDNSLEKKVGGVCLFSGNMASASFGLAMRCTAWAFGQWTVCVKKIRNKLL